MNRTGYLAVMTLLEKVKGTIDSVNHGVARDSIKAGRKLTSASADLSHAIAAYRAKAFDRKLGTVPLWRHFQQP